MTKYQFTDTDLAARRLEYLAKVYAASTRDFIFEAVVHRPQLVLDLGCGPGYTTHFLAQLTQCHRAIGLDNSKRFISLAEQTQANQVSFCLHEVTSVPFPVEPGDLLYCRYLLSHLDDPLNVVGQWATQLQPQGLLLIEEVEWIRTTHEVFTTYLGIIEALLANQSAQLYVGPTLNRLEHTALLKKRSSQVRHIPVSTRQAATMFYMNIQSWKHQPFVQATYAAKMIAELEDDLKSLSTAPNNTGDIEWGLRQLVLERL
jgi:trans-aconitate 2-methyltransferase